MDCHTISLARNPSGLRSCQKVNIFNVGRTVTESAEGVNKQRETVVPTIYVLRHLLVRFC